jgi:RNA polymerase sigma factor FliA
VSIEPSIGCKLVERDSNVEASLWRQFHVENKQSYRDRLFGFYQALTRSIALGEFRRRPRYGLDFDDFLQLALSGLLEAIDRFDPLRGSPFEAFARRRIKGSISDGVAKSSEGAAQYTFVRRQHSERIASLMAQNDLEQNTHLQKLSEVVVGLAIGMLLEASALDLVSTPEPDPYDCLAFNDMKRVVMHELSDLPDPGGLVLRRHYLDGIPFGTIAQSLNLSKGRISQIHKDALIALKAKFYQLDWKRL